jgi:hypothetical protein
MQNFKSFLLKENDGIEDKSYFTIQFHLSSNVIDKSEYMNLDVCNSFLKEKLQKEYPEIYKDISDFEYLYIVKTLAFCVDINKDNGTKLDEIISKLSKLAEEFFNSDNFAVKSSAIVFIKNQDYLIKCDEIKLFFDKNGVNSLKDIHKKIDCIQLKIWNIDTVEEGGLGLLLIKRLKQIINLSVGINKWLDIIKKHLLQDKDILDCQEELILNGYKDNAKL